MRTERAISIYLALVALVTVAQSVMFPVYGYEPDGTAGGGALAVWHVLNWFMALGLAAMLSTTYREKRRLDAETSSDLRPWVGASAKFYLTVLLTVAFVPNWFAAIFERGEVGLVWYAINTSIPILFALESIRLRRATSGWAPAAGFALAGRVSLPHVLAGPPGRLVCGYERRVCHWWRTD